MGARIDMENKVDKLIARVETLEAQVRGMVSTIDEIKPNATRKVMVNETNEQKSDKKTVGKSSNSSNKGHAKSKSKAK